MLRSLLFNVGAWSWTLLLLILCLPGLLMPRRVVNHHAARLWLGGIRAMLHTLVGLDHEVRGRERLPPGPVIFAVKHQSAWETLTLHLVIDDPAIALKRELTLIPLFGWYALRAGMIRIDRGHGTRALRSLITGARKALDRGQPVVIFPEGTRVAPGERRPYHPGVAGLYLQLNVPVVPVALNSGLFWGRRAFVKRPGRIVVEFLDSIPPGLTRRRFMEVLEERLEGATNRLIAEARPALPDAPIG